MVCGERPVLSQAADAQRHAAGREHVARYRARRPAAPAPAEMLPSMMVVVVVARDVLDVLQEVQSACRRRVRSVQLELPDQLACQAAQPDVDDAVPFRRVCSALLPMLACC